MISLEIILFIDIRNDLFIFILHFVTGVLVLCFFMLAWFFTCRSEFTSIIIVSNAIRIA